MAEIDEASALGVEMLGVGDIGLLGQGFPPKIRQHRAVVMGAAADYCAVGVLEQLCIGQCCLRFC